MSIEYERKELQRNRSQTGHLLKKLHREERISHKLVLPNNYTSKQALKGLMVCSAILAAVMSIYAFSYQTTAQTIKTFIAPPHVDVQGGVEWEPTELDVVSYTEAKVDERITQVAIEYDYPADELIALAIFESELNPDEIGGDYDCFHGLYQWNLCSTDWITHDCSLDVECSTIKTIESLQKGEQWRWPSYF